MRIGLDAMGGDHAPGVEVKGAVVARQFLGQGDRIVLIGDRSAILEHLDAAGDWGEYIDIRHTEQVIGMDEAPVEALRSKPDSSIAVMAQMQVDGELDACISAGNTGACVAASQMRLRRLRGVYRPGIAIAAPSFFGPVVLCDVGANVNCRPRHLHQYGVMASVYARAVYGVENPRVAILSIGEEDAKGNQLVKQTRELMLNDPSLKFVGNIDGRDVFNGMCDVVVCDGFVGNVVLKLMEGMAGTVIRIMLHELTAAMPDQQGAAEVAARVIRDKYDFNEYGGAPLLGVAGISIICHGASDHRGIMNAVRVAVEFSNHQVNEQITELLAKRQRTTNG